MNVSDLEKLSEELEHDLVLMQDILKTYEEERQAMERLKSEEDAMLKAITNKDMSALESIIKFLKV